MSPFVHVLWAFVLIQHGRGELDVNANDTELEVDANDTLREVNISWSSQNDERGSITTCVGFNVDTDTCDKAKGDVAIYNKSGIAVWCDNCYVGINAEYFFDLETTKKIKPTRASGGFRNMVIKVGLGLGVEVAKDTIWNYLGQIFKTDRKTGKIASFGPFDIFLIGDLDIGAYLDMLEIPRASAGVSLVIEIGDHFATWTKGIGWKTTNQKPKISVKPYAEGPKGVGLKGPFNATTTLGFKVATKHWGDLFSFKSKLSPKVDMKVETETDFLSSPQVCSSGDYDASLSAEAGLHAGHLFEHKLASVKLWGAGDQIPKTCVRAGAGTSRGARTFGALSVASLLALAVAVLLH